MRSLINFQFSLLPDTVLMLHKRPCRAPQHNINPIQGTRPRRMRTHPCGPHLVSQHPMLQELPAGEGGARVFVRVAAKTFPILIYGDQGVGAKARAIQSVPCTRQAGLVRLEEIERMA